MFCLLMYYPAFPSPIQSDAIRLEHFGLLSFSRGIFLEYLLYTYNLITITLMPISEQRIVFQDSDTDE